MTTALPQPIDVLCIGHAAYDVSMFVDEYPAENSKHETYQSTESGGGPAANAAYLLSKWGLRCAFAGLVGDDAYGRSIRDEFMAVGTDTNLLELRPAHSTPLSLVLINRQNGSRTLVNRKAKGATLAVCAAALSQFAPRLLMFDGHELQASLLAMELFPNAITVLDAGSWREGTADLAGRVNILAASERFAKQATGAESPTHETIRLLRDKYPTTCVVTMGERGLLYDEGKGCHQLPAFAVEPIDTTAAGDIFHGALAYAIIQSLPLPEALRFSSMAAALSVQKAGGRASVPSLDEVQNALASGAISPRD